MKNKKVTYAAAVLLVGIWGTVFYKIFSNPSSDFDLVPPKDEFVFKVDSDFVEKPKFDLRINYPDPFLKDAPKEKTEELGFQTTGETKKKQQNKSVVKKVKKVIWPNIDYLGYVDNQANLRVNNRSYLLSEGDSIVGVHLVSINKDSVQVKYQKEFKYYSK